MAQARDDSITNVLKASDWVEGPVAHAMVQAFVVVSANAAVHGSSLISFVFRRVVSIWQDVIAGFGCAL